MIKIREVIPELEGVFSEVYGLIFWRVYATCKFCGKEVQVNKLFFGSLHFCKRDNTYDPRFDKEIKSFHRKYDIYDCHLDERYEKLIQESKPIILKSKPWRNKLW